MNSPGGATMPGTRPPTEKLAIPLAIAMAATSFAFDLSQPLGVSAGIPYIILPLIGLLTRSSTFVVVAAICGTALIGVGMLLSAPGIQADIVYLNRAMSAVLVWITAFMAIRHLSVGDKLRQQLRELAATDPLTGLYNRRHVFESINRELKRYGRYGERFALILIDADHFKRVNDTYGHAAGDATLGWIARVCLQSVRETDVVGRFGGEEFIILLPHTTANAAALVAERIRRGMHDEDSQLRDGAKNVTLSLGVADVGPTAATFNDILKAADEALYAAKRSGRDQVATKSSDEPKPRAVNAA